MIVTVEAKRVKKLICDESQKMGMKRKLVLVGFFFRRTLIKNDNCILFFQLHLHVFLRIGFQFSKTCLFSFTMRRNDRNCTHANIKGIRGFTFSHDLYDKTCIGASWRAKYV